MSKLQRLSRENVDELRERLRQNRTNIAQSDLEKPSKIVTRPRIFDLRSSVAPTNKQR